MEKVALFVFNGDPMCFVHVLLNALDLSSKGRKARIVVEGSATQLIADLASKENPLHGLWQKVKDQGLVAGVCRACSNKSGTLEAAKEQGLTLLDDMQGHPSISRYQDDGYTIITF
jgi:hypothetical protein